MRFATFYFIKLLLKIIPSELTLFQEQTIRSNCSFLWYMQGKRHFAALQSFSLNLFNLSSPLLEEVLIPVLCLQLCVCLDNLVKITENNVISSKNNFLYISSGNMWKGWLGDLVSTQVGSKSYCLKLG